MPRKHTKLEIQPVLFVKAKKDVEDQTENCTKKTSVKHNDDLLSGRNTRSFYDELVGTSFDTTSSQEHTDDTESGHMMAKNKIEVKKRKFRNIDGLKKQNRSSKGKLLKAKSKLSTSFGADSVDCTSNPDKFSDRDKLNFLRLAQEGDNKALSVYLQEGMDLNVFDQFGWTALMCASCSGQAGVVKLLLRKGADKTLVNSQGQTARDIALEVKKQHIADLLGCSNLDKDNIDTESLNASFYCDTCKCNITESSEKAHSTTTLHLFNSKLPVKGTNYFLTESNKGFQMMIQSGWDKDKGLGTEGKGQKFPVKTVLKRDRLGLGNKVKESAKVTHFGPKDNAAVKNPNIREMRKSTLSKRKRSRQERRERKNEKAFRREFYSD